MKCALLGRIRVVFIDRTLGCLDRFARELEMIGMMAVNASGLAHRVG